MLARGNENFRAPGENRTRDLPNTRSDVLELFLPLLRIPLCQTDGIERGKR